MKSRISRVELQPQPLPSLIPSRNARSAIDSSAAPATSTRAGERTGDSGTNAQVRTAAGAVTISADQNNQDRPTCSTSTPASTSATPPPMPSIDDSAPIPTATRWGGSSSRTMPIPSGNIAAPIPCTVRPASTTANEPATAESSMPAANAVSATSSMRALPYMSPSRPSIGVAMAELSRKLVRSQADVLALTP